MILESFSGSYKRINKLKGRKILRCFPHCKSIHESSGFYGSAVTLQLPSATDIHVQYWARFEVVEAEDSMTVGSEILASLFENNQRTKEYPLNEWLLGEMKSPTSVKFNDQLMPWQCSWRSHKTSTDLMHCFKIYAIEKFEGNRKVKIVSVVSSPHFNVYYSRSKDRERPVPNFKRNYSDLETAVCSLKNLVWIPEEPLTFEQALNRTIDRLRMFFSSFDGLSIDEQSPLRFASLERVLVGSPESFQVISKLRLLREQVMLGFAGMKQNYCTEWLSRQNEFVLQCLKEMEEQIQWSASLEDETSLETSIFGKMRHIKRGIVAQAVALTGCRIEDFKFVMETASVKGLLPLDPFHPPCVLIGCAIWRQLGPHLDPFEHSTYSAGSNTFATEEIRLFYGHQLLMYRRAIHQSTVAAYTKHVFTPITEVGLVSPDTRIDFSGVWLDTDAADGIAFETYPGVLGLIIGSLTGELFKKMGFKICLVLNKDSYTVSPWEVMVSSYIFDGKPGSKVNLVIED